MTKFILKINTSEKGVLTEHLPNYKTLYVNLIEYNIDYITYVRDGDEKNIHYYSYNYDEKTGILNIKTQKHQNILLEYFSIKEERNIKIDKIILDN